MTRCVRGMSCNAFFGVDLAFLSARWVSGCNCGFIWDWEGGICMDMVAERVDCSGLSMPLDVG